MFNRNVFRKQKVVVSAILYFIFSLQPVISLANKTPDNSKSIYTRIAQQSLPAYSEMKNIFAIEESKYDPKKPKYSLNITKLSDFEKRNIFFSIFHSYGKKCHKHDTKVFVDDYWKDLDFFCGPVNKKKASIFNQINHTKTIPGEIILQRRLTQATTNILDLEKWQMINKELVKEKKLTALLGKILGNFNKSQNHLLTFWKKENPFNEEIFKKVYFTKPGFKKLNQNPIALEAYRRWSNFIDLGFKVFSIPFGLSIGLANASRHYRHNIECPNWQHDYSVVGSVKSPEEFAHAKKLIAKTKIFNRVHSKEYNCYYDTRGTSIDRRNNITEEAIKKFKHPSPALAYPLLLPPKAIWDLIINSPEYIRKAKDFLTAIDLPPVAKISLFGGLAFLLGVSAYMTYNGINSAKLENNITTYLQERLIGVSSAVKSMKKVAEIVQSNKMLNKHISTKEIDLLEDKTAQLGKLIKLLMTNTFTGKASFFSLSGRVLAAYKIMNEVKNQLTPAFEELGLIDAHYSTAQLYNKFKDSDHRYCYPKYIKNVNTPYIKSENFWFPGLLNDPNLKKVITNSVGMGNSAEQNILLTGPNAGGKSTILKGIVTMIILAQTIGIAPAKSLSLTPFSKVQTYINIVDSAAEGVSTFRAELNRARDLLNTITGLPQKEFSFTIFDEVFRGTNPEEAIQGSAYLAAILGKMPNSMSIIATHFGLLTKLEDLLPGIYTNYQVTAIKKATRFHYPFTWQPGVSKHKIATDLMRFENLKDPDGLNMSERFSNIIEEYGIR